MIIFLHQHKQTKIHEIGNKTATLDDVLEYLK